MRATIAALANRRAIVMPSASAPGHVRFDVQGADRQTVAYLTLTPDAAAVLADALHRAAVDAEAVMTGLLAGEGVGHG